MHIGFRVFVLFGFCIVVCVLAAYAQGGNSGSIEGIVKDPSGASVPHATVEISNLVSGYSRTTSTAADGNFRFTNVPFNPYHMNVTAAKFAPYSQDIEVRSGLPLRVEAALKLSTEATTVNVTENGGDLVENEPTFHSDIDRKLFDRTHWKAVRHRSHPW